SMPHGPRGCPLPMAGIDPILPPALKDRMAGDQPATIEDPDHVRQLVHFDDTPRAIRHAVVIFADRDEPFMLTRRSSFSSASKGAPGRGWRSGFSAAKASETIRCVVA